MHGRITRWTTRIVAARAIKDTNASPAPFTPHVVRPVIEVPAGADGVAIQQAIDQAAAMKGRQPVVYLPMGNYSIITRWSSPPAPTCSLSAKARGKPRCTAAPTPIRCSAWKAPRTPSSRKSIAIAGKDAMGILVDNCSQPGSRIFGEQVCANGRRFRVGVRWLNPRGHRDARRGA